MHYSTFTYGVEGFNKKIQQLKSNVKKKELMRVPFCFTRNKAGNTRTIAPKESIYKKGWDEL